MRDLRADDRPSTVAARDADWSIGDDHRDEHRTLSDEETAAELRHVRSRGRFGIGLILGGLVAVAAALLVVQNGHETTFDWLWLDFEAPLWLLLAATFAAGAVVAEAVRALARRSRTRAARRRDALRRAQETLAPSPRDPAH
ncbi:MAG: lipopolysaccharide assembly protein LapA domain-containing protein [Acidimicrobiia bacterium]